METRNDGSKGKTAAELIAEDATRSNKSNPDSYENAVDYEGDEGNLDADDIVALDDDFLDNDGLTENEDEEEKDDLDPQGNI